MNRYFSFLLFALCLPLSIAAQIATSGPEPSNGGMAVSPARFELEMRPGSETTVVVNLDYRAPENTAQPVRIVATLNDWTITKDARVEYYPANTRPDSASPWLIYSPGEAAVAPGTIHQIRVTISVPENATPGDHLTALIVEQRPETLKYQQSARQMIVRYRMASVFYIKVSGLTKHGSVEDLYAESTSDGFVVTPTLRNEGNSMIRPIASIKVLDSSGTVVADLPESERMPVLANSELSQAFRIDKPLPTGAYTVKYRVDFQDGGKSVEGITELLVGTQPQIASAGKAPQKP